jgi:hypothetical protein
MRSATVEPIENAGEYKSPVNRRASSEVLLPHTADNSSKSNEDCILPRQVWQISGIHASMDLIS